MIFLPNVDATNLRISVIYSPVDETPPSPQKKQQQKTRRIDDILCQPTYNDFEPRTVTKVKQISELNSILYL